MKTVKVEAAGSTYDIYIGKNLLFDTGRLILDKLSPQKMLIVTDRKVKPLYFEALQKSLKAQGLKVYCLLIPCGEKAKTPETLFKIITRLSDLHFCRNDCVAALGGGTVGDTAGLAASLYMRGIKLVQIPTTLLAMVDSSLGGKTAVDFNGSKNLIGTFYHPQTVICDTSVLKSLPENEKACGYAEIIKYGMIKDVSVLEDIISKNADIEDIICRCITVKANLVKSDERDNGVRHLLNFGHTFGHGIEAANGYKLPHGYCVAAGMYIITNACVKSGFCQKECLDILKKTFDACGIGISGLNHITQSQILKSALNDKKQTGDGICLVIPINPGVCQIKEFAFSDIKSLLKSGLEGIL